MALESLVKSEPQTQHPEAARDSSGAGEFTRAPNTPARPRARDPFAVLTGALGATLGLLVLLGRHAGFLPLVNWHTGFKPVAYNTAVTFAVLGLALVLLGAGRRPAAKLAAGLAVLIAFGRLCEYLTGFPQSYETLFSRFTFPNALVPSVPMAPNTAIALVSIAAAIWLLADGWEFHGKAAVIALCGSAAAFLGLNAFAGYLTGLNLYGWGGFQPMALPASAGVVALGTGILMIHWRAGQGGARDPRSWTAMLILAAGAVTAVSFWQALLAMELRQRQSDLAFRSPLPETVFVFGLLMTVALSAAAYWAQTARLRSLLARRAAAYNRRLIEASLDPLVTIAPDGRITDVNQTTVDVTGRSREELVGTDFSDYFTEPDKARQGYQRVFREGRVRDYELALRRSDGHITPVLYNASVYRDENGTVAGVFAAARDVTARKRAEEVLERRAQELARSNADLEQFAYVASHDLQEPLRMVANFTQLLADRYRDRVGEEGAEFISYAVAGAIRMQRLIEDLLTYSRVGTRGKRFEPADCNEVLGQAEANLQAAIAENGAVVTHDELPTVMGDGSQLTQVFQNLVGNAVKFRSKQPPRIHIAAARQEKQWIFSVQDNGIGIDPKYAERIFVIFQRLHGREEYPGTGIGLALCKKIVERHGGRIWVESQPGQGATFHFTIPAG